LSGRKDFRPRRSNVQQLTRYWQTNKGAGDQRAALGNRLPKAARPVTRGVPA
jgi:hypothetical protein